MNSNLTPVPRTDKNGNRIIRYMRNLTKRPDRAVQLPPVTIAALTPSAEERATTLYASLSDVPGAEVPEMTSFKSDFIEISTHYPELAKTIERVLTTGSDAARNVALKVTKVCFDISKQSVSRHPTFEAMFQSRLRERWNAMNVGEETGLSHTLNLNTPPKFIDVGSHSTTARFSDNTWRGHAALRLVLEVPGGKLPDSSHPIMGFIVWAGHRDDLRAVIDLVRERGTLDTKLLEALLAAASEAPSALQEGLL